MTIFFTIYWRKPGSYYHQPTSAPNTQTRQWQLQPIGNVPVVTTQHMHTRGVARTGPKAGAHLDIGISRGPPPRSRENNDEFGYFTRTTPRSREKNHEFGHFTRTTPKPRGSFSPLSLSLAVSLYMSRAAAFSRRRVTYCCERATSFIMMPMTSLARDVFIMPYRSKANTMASNKKYTVKSRHNAHHRANAHPPFQRQKSCKGVIFLLVIAQSVYF